MKSLLDDVLNTCSDALIVYNPAGKPAFWNRAMLTLARVPEEEIASCTSEIIWSRFAELLDGTPAGDERPEDSDDGPRRQMLPLRDGRVLERLIQRSDFGGEPIRVEWYRDVTACTRAARRGVAQRAHAQKMKAIGRLAGGVAHDFNNILTAITCHSELLTDELGERSGLQEVIGAASSGAYLTRQLLAFSRQQHLRPSVVDVTQIVRGMTGMLRQLIGDGIQLDIALSDSLPPIAVDPGQLEQVLVNLVVNARDAMPDGGRLTISARRLSWDGRNPDRSAMPAGEYLALRVEDSGPVIPDDVLPHVFEPFFSSRSGGATGLGLATVFGIVKQSGGFVWVESAVDRGTAFSIEFPVAGTAAADGPGTAVPSDVADVSGRRTILVAEDQENVRRIVVRFLYGEGHRIIEAASGLEALRLAEGASPIDLLVTDVVMPQMSGPELSARLRERWPGLRTVYTSGFSTEYLEVAPDALFVPKPFNRASLLNKVREALSWCPR